jgi:hypothetical protein
MNESTSGTIQATADITTAYHDFRLEELEKRLAALEEDHDNLKQFSLEHIKNLINRANH